MSKTIFSIIAIVLKMLYINCLYSEKQTHITRDFFQNVSFQEATEHRQTDPPEFRARSIAEFEPMKGVLIRYPLGIPLSLVALLAQHVEVVTIVSSQAVESQAIASYQNYGVDLENCSFIIAQTNSHWTRDYGPWFIFDGNNEVGVVDFNYNTSLGFPRPLDNMIPFEYANHFNIDYYHMGIDHVGGNYMSDGMGIAASTHMAYTENPNLDPSEVDQIMYDFLGIGLYHVVDDPTDCWLNHIDTWAKFLAVDKIMIRSVPTWHPQYYEIESVVDYFASQESSFGNPYRIYRVYTPDNQPYINSLILNNNVYVPLVGSNWDDFAIQSYEDAMPGYNIHGVYYANWYSIDALHCRTREIVDDEMLYIKHYPVLGLQELQENYSIQVYIYPHSGEELIENSLNLNISINGQDYGQIPLTEYDENEYEAFITGIAAGDTVSYYISAADYSGRYEKHPFIGEFDPHVFYIEPEIVYPEFHHDYQEVLFIHQFPFLMELTIENINSLQSVMLQYTVNSDLLNYEFLQNDLENSELWSVLFSPVIDVGDLIDYRFIILDSLDPGSPIYYPETGWFVTEIDIKQLEKPHYDPEPGIFEESILVEIISEEDADIHYTLDGSTPSEESFFYTGPILVEKSLQIKSIASKEYFLSSEVKKGQFIIKTSDSDSSFDYSEIFLNAFPNPFNPDVNISFYLNSEQDIKLEVFNLSGQRIVVLAEGFYEQGFHSIKWNTDKTPGLSTGVYLYRLKMNQYSKTKKIILLK